MPVMVMFRKPLLNRRITKPDPTSALPPTGDDWSFTWHEQGSPFGLRPFPAFAKTVRPAHYKQDCHTWSPPLRQGYTKSVSPNISPCQNPSRLCKSMSMGRGAMTEIESSASQLSLARGTIFISVTLRLHHRPVYSRKY